MEHCGPLGLVAMNHISRCCSDVTASAQFYTQVLGFHPVKRPTSFEFEGAWLHGYGIGMHLIKGCPPPRPSAINPKACHISFQACSLEAVEDRLRSWGVPFVQNVFFEDGVRVGQLFFHDPDNNMIEVCNCDVLPVVPLGDPNEVPHHLHHHYHDHCELEEQEQQLATKCSLSAAACHKLAVAAFPDPLSGYPSQDTPISLPVAAAAAVASSPAVAVPHGCGKEEEEDDDEEHGGQEEELELDAELLGVSTPRGMGGGGLRVHSDMPRASPDAAVVAPLAVAAADAKRVVDSRSSSTNGSITSSKGGGSSRSSAEMSWQSSDFDAGPAASMAGGGRCHSSRSSFSSLCSDMSRGLALRSSPVSVSGEGGYEDTFPSTLGGLGVGPGAGGAEGMGVKAGGIGLKGTEVEVADGKGRIACLIGGQQQELQQQVVVVPAL